MGDADANREVQDIKVNEYQESSTIKGNKIQLPDEIEVKEESKEEEDHSDFNIGTQPTTESNDSASLSLARKYAIGYAIFSSLARLNVRWFNSNFSDNESSSYMVTRLAIISVLSYCAVLISVSRNNTSSSLKSEPQIESEGSSIKIPQPNNNSYFIKTLKVESLIGVFYSNPSAKTTREKYSNWIFFGRVLVTSSYMFMFYLTYANLKLSIATVLNQLQPITLNILSFLILKEKMNKKYFIAFVFATVGIVIITKGGESSSTQETTSLALNNTNNSTYSNISSITNITDLQSLSNIESLSINHRNELIGYISCFIGVLLVNLMLIFSNLLGKKYDAMNLCYVGYTWATVLYFLISVILGDINLSSYKIFLNLYFWVIAGLNGVASFFGFYCLQLSVSLNKVSKVSYLFFLQIPIITVLGFIFFGETLNLIEFIGALIVISSIIITTVFVK